MLTASLLILAFIIAYPGVAAGRAVGLVDVPDGRKCHGGAIPLTGGVTVFVTILVGTLAFDIAPYTTGTLAIAGFVFALGVFDDLHPINSWLRLGIHYVSGILLATWGGIAIVNVGNLLAMGDIPLLFLTIPLTALSVAGLSNAYNMIDGIDGLAAATIALPLAVLYLLALQAGHPHAHTLLLMLVPLAVFLLFNLGPNNRLLPKMFLGDGGSVTLGFLVTASLVFFSQGDNALIEPVTALWLVTVPLMDMLATMLRRAKNGRRMMEADRSHLHHTLMDMGLSARQTLAVLVGWAILCAGTGLALEAIPAYLSLLCYFLLFLGHCLFVMKSPAIGRRLNPRLANENA
jgi:UDP-GlcNAc:undecaprenyl-phosphate GlcNAc-1-phosphate transferase